jgi:hypothetical protein
VLRDNTLVNSSVVPSRRARLAMLRRTYERCATHSTTYHSESSLDTSGLRLTYLNASFNRLALIWHLYCIAMGMTEVHCRSGSEGGGQTAGHGCCWRPQREVPAVARAARAYWTSLPVLRPISVSSLRAHYLQSFLHEFSLNLCFIPGTGRLSS